MLCEADNSNVIFNIRRVLILVLMEYALRVNILKATIMICRVLILVLMEYALRV